MSRVADIEVRWTFPGFHRWPTAPPHRAYLASPHRHLFHASVRLHVTHDDREVEFHDLLEHAQAALGARVDFGTMSCEQLCDVIASHVEARWPHRRMTIEVFEDGEAGAVVTYYHEP